MQLIALTGGIASGKSTIGRRLEALGATRIDADQLAREAVLPGTAGLQRIVERFGPDVLGAGGELDRAALGRIVFEDDAARADLNAIVHPAVRELASQRIEAARDENPEAVVVYEIPLLVESGTTMPWDLVVVAEAPAEERVRRLVALRGMRDEAEARRRVDIQASDAARRAVADVVIDTGGTEHGTLEQVDALWRRLTSDGTPRSSRVGTGRPPR